MGIIVGDLIVATSATAGDQMWSHDTVEGIKSALSTRFVMSASVKMRFERSLQSIPEHLIDHLRVPFFFRVQMKRPIGLHVVEGNDNSVLVESIKPDLGAARYVNIC